jgi:acyl-CoA dehydrogenase
MHPRGGARHRGGGSPAGLWDAWPDAGFLDLLAPEARAAPRCRWRSCSRCWRNSAAMPCRCRSAQAIVARALSGRACPVAGWAAHLGTGAATRRRRQHGLRRWCRTAPSPTMCSPPMATGLLLSCAVRSATPPADGRQAARCDAAWTDAAAAAALAGDARALAPLGAALYAALLAGAMARVFEMTLQYCNDRSQFGKSLGKFQAVQHQLSVMAEQWRLLRSPPSPLSRPLGAPRACCLPRWPRRVRARPCPVANTAHALHGAIGVTEEYDLQLFTRRLHEWRWRTAARATGIAWWASRCWPATPRWPSSCAPSRPGAPEPWPDRCRACAWWTSPTC